MAKTVVLKARGPPDFTCRFCEESHLSYGGLLSHELEQHFLRFSCRECPPTLTQFLAHLKDDHRRVLEQDELARLSTLAPTESVESLHEAIDGKPANGWNPKSDVHDGGSALFEDCSLGEEVVLKTLTEGAESNGADVQEPESDQIVHVRLDEDPSAWPPEPSPKPSAKSKSSKKSTGLSRKELARIKKRLCYVRFRLRDDPDAKFAAVFDELDAVEGFCKDFASRLCANLARDATPGDECEYEDVASERTAEELAAERAAKFLSTCHGAFSVDLPTRSEMRAKKGPFLCDVCAQPMARAPALEAHRAAVHGVKKTFNCLRCNFGSNRRVHLFNHVYWSQFGKFFKCRRRGCELYFSSVAERTKHVAEDHGVLRCPICLEGFDVYHSLEHHKMKYHVELYPAASLSCRLCHTEFRTRLESYLHERQCRMLVNNRVRDPAYRRSLNGFVHMERPRKDGGATDWEKRRRLERARMYLQWKRSRETEEEREERLLRQKAACKKYMDKKKAERSACSLCRLACWSERDREVHEANCHVSDEEGVMHHVCPRCPESFSKMKEYRLHLNQHPELGLIQCPHCPKAFFHRPALNLHVRVSHTAVVHECDYCDATFKRKHQLLDHVREHEGNPRHVCACGMKFYRGPTFYDHRRRCDSRAQS